MPDLSNLLGAVYGDGPSPAERDHEDEAHVEKEPAAAERRPAVPDWADDDHLDAAFAQWKPGPSADASPAEHAFVMESDEDPAPPLADDLAAALSEALVAASGTADSTEVPPGHEPPKHFDFSVSDDEADEPQDFSKSGVHSDERMETEQPHELGEVSEVEDVVAPEPEMAPEPELVAEPEPDPEPEPELSSAPEPEPDPDPVVAPHLDETDDEADEDEVYEAPRPSFTTQRAAAAELTAANRVEPESVVAQPEPEPEFAPMTPAPMAVTPEPTPVPKVVAGDGATAPATLPVGTRRWDRSDDDILPEKQGKKFFSFSLRRG